MRVMGPDYDSTSAAIEVSQERLNGPGHVLVAQVPGGSAPSEHGPVIAFGIRNQARVLFGVEKLRARPVTVLLHHFGGAAAQLHQLSDRFIFTRLAHSFFRGVTVQLGIAKILETSVTLPGASSRSGVYLVEVTQHLRDG